MSSNDVSIKERIRRTIYFFPFQLVLVHLKSNHALLIFWLFLWGMVNKSILSKYGAFNLFLYPEYMGEVDFLSHVILGLSIGGFIVAFNIASYILNGAKFPMLATLNKPFVKFCLNNFIIPSLFLLFFIYELFQFQKYQELQSWTVILRNISGLFAGMIVIIFLTFTYFFNTNKSLSKLFGDSITGKSKKPKKSPVKSVLNRKEKWYSFLARKKEWKVVTYLSNPFKISLARDISHYDHKMLQTVFAQNHLNASIFEILVIVSIIFFSIFRENPLFELPAAASMMLMITVVLMLSSAIYSWLNGWATIAFVIGLFGYNALTQMPQFSFKSSAFGLNYDQEFVPYSNEKIAELSRDENQIEQDEKLHLGILEKWKQKQQSDKPKLVLLNVSGGGLRASVWSTQVMQYLDSSLNGQFLDKIHLITGSSGGLVGAAYYRELFLKKQSSSSINNRFSTQKIDNISKDLLNPVFLSLSLHDWAYGRKEYHFGGKYYRKDRGYAFEQQLMENTECFGNKRLGDYRKPEIQSDIPIVLLSPTITNDGRKMNISSIPFSFIEKPIASKNEFHCESVEFNRLFQNHGADSLRYLSALRMNATFFYVLPGVTLPTKPEIEIMDAGIRDNMGLVNTLRYIQVFKDWILENTSGVLLVQVRDGEKQVKINEYSNTSVLNSLVKPIEGVYSNYLSIQEFNQDEIFRYLEPELRKMIQIENIELEREGKRSISLSWHLTRKEKEQIKASLKVPKNTQALNSIISTIQ